MFSLLSSSCIKKNESKTINYSSIENEYLGAFDTFYKYIKTLNENKLSNILFLPPHALLFFSIHQYQID